MAGTGKIGGGEGYIERLVELEGVGSSSSILVMGMCDMLQQCCISGDPCRRMGEGYHQIFGYYYHSYI